jgi:lauroyl/myristoyl acyltransferase
MEESVPRGGRVPGLSGSFRRQAKKAFSQLAPGLGLLSSAVQHADYFCLYPLLSRLPLGAAHRILSLRRPYSCLLPSERRRLLENLDRAFLSKALSPGAIRRIAARHMLFVSRMRADARIAVERPVEEWHRYTRFEGLHHLEEAMAAERGVLLLTCHSGYIYRALHALPRAGVPIHVITVRAGRTSPTIWPGPAGRSLYEEILRRMAAEPGLSLVYRGSGPEAARGLLEGRHVVVTAVDNPSAREDQTHGTVRVRFLSGYSVFSSALFRAAEEFGTPTLPFLVHSNGPDCTIRILPSVRPPVSPVWAGRAPAPHGEVGDRAQALFRLFEQHILRYPEQWWLWKDLGAFRLPE